MAYETRVVKNAQLVEYGKFIELANDSRYPAVSVVRVQYPDASDAFPSNKGLPPLTSVDVYPKYAVLSYIANPDDIKVSLSAENINVNLADVETILNVISPDVTTIKNNTDAVESTLTIISNNIGTTNTNVGTINTNVADIETLLIRSNSLVNSVSAQVSTMDARVFNIHGHVSTIDTRTSAITALLTSTNTLVNSVSALLGNQLGINGVVFCQPSDGTVTQNFNAIQVLSACKFSAIGIAKSSTTGLTSYELPQNFTLTAPITSLALSYGAIIAFK
jgi:ABC-type transporter Mla subunit MlaD